MWLVHLSGGFDSTAVALWCRDRDILIKGIFYDYGQSYREQEYQAARKVADRIGFPLFDFQLPLMVDSNTAVPEYIPYRNLVLIAHSLNVASAAGADAVAVGFKSEHPEEGNPYAFRDAGRVFLDDTNKVVAHISELGQKPPKVVMPLAGWSKKDIVAKVLNHFRTVELWNCYVDGEKPCGKCHHCVELKEVVSKLGVRG